ncbi:MAG: FAD binding domain-containing protein [Thermoanaerobaculia bacterium]
MSLAELSLHAFERPGTLAEVCRTLSRRAGKGDETVLLAGGTDWVVSQHLAPPSLGGELPLVLDISRVPELRGIHVVGEKASVGAAATYLELRQHGVLSRRVPMLTAMARDVGALQIQARGTLGGNLATASPAADGSAALMALDADVVLASLQGERRVPIAQWFTAYRRTARAPDEVIVRVEFALPRASRRQLWRKVGTRAAQSISKVALAAVGEYERGRCVRVGLGMASVAPVTVSLPSVRALAVSPGPLAVPDDELDAAVRRDISPIDDFRSTAAYRAHVASALVRGFFKTLRPVSSPG